MTPDKTQLQRARRGGAELYIAGFPDWGGAIEAVCDQLEQAQKHYEQLEDRYADVTTKRAEAVRKIEQAQKERDVWKANAVTLTDEYLKLKKQWLKELEGIPLSEWKGMAGGAQKDYERRVEAERLAGEYREALRNHIVTDYQGNDKDAEAYADEVIAALATTEGEGEKP